MVNHLGHMNNFLFQQLQTMQGTSARGAQPGSGPESGGGKAASEPPSKKLRMGGGVPEPSHPPPASFVPAPAPVMPAPTPMAPPPAAATAPMEAPLPSSTTPAMVPRPKTTVPRPTSPSPTRVNPYRNVTLPGGRTGKIDLSNGFEPDQLTFMQEAYPGVEIIQLGAKVYFLMDEGL